MKNEKTFTNPKLHRMIVTAMMLALSTVIALLCGLISFLNLPFGGSITIASMLPIVLISYMYGIKWGLFTGGVYSVIQMFLGHSTVSGLFTPGNDSYQGIWIALCICLLDYILAYMSLGLGGIFRKKIANKGLSLCLGSIVALAVCYAFHMLSGFIFYGAWAEWFFGDTIIADWAVSKWILQNISGKALAFVYSLVYNGCYMIPEIILTAILAFPIAKIPRVRVETVENDVA